MGTTRPKTWPPRNAFRQLQQKFDGRQQEERVRGDQPRSHEQNEKLSRIQSRLQDAMAGTDRTPLTVRTVMVQGSEYTRQSLFSACLDPVYRARTLGDVLGETQRLVNRLKRLGIFEEVHVMLDKSKMWFGVGSEEEGVDLVLLVKERKRLWAKTGTEMGATGGNLNTSINFRNVFGGGETVEATAAYGVETEGVLDRSVEMPLGSTATSSFSFVFGKPVKADPDRRLEIGAFRVDRNHLVHSSHMELVNGAFSRYRWPTLWGNAELGYNLVWRNIHNLARDASSTVRNEAGHSLKSSITASIAGDSRDDSLLPTSGGSYRFSCELAGLLESRVRFAKTEAEGSWATYLGYGFSLAASARTGALLARGGSKINDRFFLGGPLTVRGFRHHGLGPKDGVDSLGGDAFWAAGISLFTPLPYLVDKPLRGHLFINAGGLGAMQNGLMETTRDIVRQPSSSAGAGFTLRFSILRLEINFCVPLTIRRGDEYRKGWHLGLGITFL